MTKCIVGIVCISLMTTTMFASNIRYYPSHSCIKPYPPQEPFNFNSQWEIDDYNNEVEQYNYQLMTYNDCIRTYIEDTNRDIEEIQRKQQEAINDANSLY